MQLGPDALLPELDRGIADDHVAVRLASASSVLQMLDGGGVIDEPQMEVAGDIVSKALNDAAAEVTGSGCQIARSQNQRLAEFLSSCCSNFSLNPKPKTGRTPFLLLFKLLPTLNPKP
jgi:hypothetical protein